MSVELAVSQTADLALDDIRRRLLGLATTIAEAPTDISAVLGVRDQAETLHAFLVSVRAAADLIIEAAETRVRAERGCGELLLEHVRLGNSRTQLWRRSRTGPARGGKARLKSGVLAQYALTPKMSTSYQALARLPNELFENELAKRRERGQPA